MGKHTVTSMLPLSVLLISRFLNVHTENVSNHTNCKTSSLARVGTSALRNAHAAVAIRLYSGRLNEL